MRTPREKEDLVWTVVSWTVLILCLIGMVILA